MFHSLNVTNTTVRKELPISLMLTAAFSVMLLDSVFDKNMVNTFTRSDGIILVLFFGVFLYHLISMARRKVDDDTSAEYPSMKKSVLLALVVLAGIIFGSNFVVDGATGLAHALGISERIISLTIIALGTSLPELVTSVTATRKGEYDIAIGNVVGSNIFNIGIVIGVPVALLGGIGEINFSYIDIAIMLVAAFLLFAFSLNDNKISKKEGFAFLFIFAIYYSYVVMATL